MIVLSLIERRQKLTKFFLDVTILLSVLFVSNVSVASQLHDDLLRTAVYVAGHMEMTRKVPTKIRVADQSINAAQFLYLAARDIGQKADSGAGNYSVPSIKLPPALYVPIKLAPRFHRTPFTRLQYQAFFREVAAKLSSSVQAPSTFADKSSQVKVRFPEALYYAVGILRAEYMLHAKPSLWRKYIISPEGLVPWSIPAQYEKWTSPLTYDSGDPGSPYTAKRYYASSAHHYEMFRLAQSVSGGAKDPYLAGERIYNWVKYQWHQKVGYSSGRMPFGREKGGFERTSYFYHTSGPPRIIISNLLRAIGIPASSAGAAFFQDRGWVNIDVHAPYGSDPKKNRFYYAEVPPPTRNMSVPSPKDHFVLEVQDISNRRTGASRTLRRMVFINPHDVLTYGPKYVVDQSGDADTIVLTVKSIQGNLFFRSRASGVKNNKDVLGPLLTIAHQHGKKVYAAVSTLIDRKEGVARPEWRQQLNSKFNRGESWPNIHISPCVKAYRKKLEQQLHNLVSVYPVDGVVLSGLYFANIFGKGDTQGHPTCPRGENWMSGVLTDYAENLVQTVRNVDPKVDTVLMSHPLLNSKNHYRGLASENLGYQSLTALAKVVDQVMLIVPSTSWVAGGLQASVWRSLHDYHAQTGRKPWVSVNLVDEWEYSSAFYLGLRDMLGVKFPISGFGLHTGLSAVGELAPALSRVAWWKIRYINSVRID